MSVVYGYVAYVSICVIFASVMYEIHVCGVCVVLCASLSVWYMHVCVHLYMQVLSPIHVLMEDRRHLCTCLSLSEIRALTEPGAHHFEDCWTRETPGSTCWGYRCMPPHSALCRPWGPEHGSSAISAWPIIFSEIRSHSSSEWPGTHCGANLGLKLRMTLLFQPSGMVSVRHIWLWDPVLED